MDRKTASEYAYAADGRGLWHRLSRLACEAASLTPGEALIVITLLSLGLWAGIWAAIVALGLVVGWSVPGSVLGWLSAE